MVEATLLKILIDNVPDPTGATDGDVMTVASGGWTIATPTGGALPSQTGQNGKYLKTDGTNASWDTPAGGSLPSQAGNSGKFLTTDGTNASWATSSGGTSGTWTPTVSNSGNVASYTMYTARWSRIGNVVTFSGSCDIDPTLAAPTVTYIDFDPPVASAFTAVAQASGFANSSSGATNQFGGIVAVPATDKIRIAFFASNTANNTFSYGGQYDVI